ncbi:lipopolysaccharide biosynthesis protein [Crossiella sp. NPDC003009]
MANSSARTAVLMGLGLAVLGASGFGFLAVVGATLTPSDQAGVLGLYLIINIIGPGLFVALEQETNRVLSSGTAAGVDPRPGIRRAALLGAGLAGVTVLVVLAISPILVERNLGGHSSLLLWIVLGTLASAAIFFARGLLAAGQQFTGYAASLATEGLTRLLPCLALALLGYATVDGYGLIFALGGAFALLVALPWLRRALAATKITAEPAEPADPANAAAVLAGHSTRTIAHGLALLGLATLLAQLVANLAPLVVTGRMPEAPAVAVAFGYAFVLTRVPLLLFGPVQAMMLPGLTAAAVRGDLAEVRRRVGLILLAVAGVGLPGALLSALVGPWLVVAFFQAKVPPSALVMGLLGLSTVLLMIAQVLQPALVAVGRHRVVTIGWVIGTAVLVAIMLLPGEPIGTAVVAQLAGPLLVALVTAGGLWRAVRDRAPVGVS